MHKYIKNKRFKKKALKKAKREEPYWGFSVWMLFPRDIEKEERETIARYNEWMDKKARYMDRGASRGETSPPKWFLQIYNRRHRAKNKNLLRHERYDDLIPDKKTASWDWW